MEDTNIITGEIMVDVVSAKNPQWGGIKAANADGLVTTLWFQFREALAVGQIIELKGNYKAEGSFLVPA